MRKRKEESRSEPVTKPCPICDDPLDQDGLCGGNRRCPKSCTHEQNSACMEIVKLVLGGKLSELSGQERIKEILNPVPF